MNKIRSMMPKETEAFIPILRETYRLIEVYKYNRTIVNEANLRCQINRATGEMQKFKPYLHRRWQAYFGVLENQQRFPIGDIICILDAIVHQMHLRAGNEGVLRKGSDMDALSPWSKEVKAFLDERRKA